MINRLVLPSVFFLAFTALAATPNQDILVQHIDATINPAQDFFRYANGKWISENPIPSSEYRWGIDRLVTNEIYARMRTISEEALQGSNPPGSNKQKIGDFYFSGMDVATIERQGLSTIAPELGKIAAISDRRTLLAEVVRLQRLGIGVLFSVSVTQDEKDSTKNSVHLSQGGLGLPNRDYYLKDDEEMKKVRDKYAGYLADVFGLLGCNPIPKDQLAQATLALETALARASRSLEELRDPEHNYNKMKITDLDSSFPSLNWPETLEGLDMDGESEFIMGQPEFFSTLNQLLETVSIDDMKNYLRVHLITELAPYLSAAVDDLRFSFYGKVLSGQQEQQPRWKRVLMAQEDYLGFALGQLYVEKYYSPDTKKRYETLTEEIRTAFKERIENLNWMTPATKQKALFKLSRVSAKVGYPDTWRDYSTLVISRNSYVENVMASRNWLFDRDIQKLGSPVDRSEWDMTPQTYNAYYNPSNNEIVLPAAAFVVPEQDDADLDDAIVYGYAGASTIGHEMTHGFDDEGRQFDADGNLVNWWAKEDEAAFLQASRLYIDQFNNYVVPGNLHVNGAATLGENIADLGGLVIALDAFKKTRQFKEGNAIAGLSPLQRFFLGYALGWMAYRTDAALQRQVLSDVHAPEYLRVNGPMANLPEFYEAFGVKEGDPMWRPGEMRVKIW